MIYFEPNTYEFHNAGKEWSYVYTRGAMRFEVRQGDYGRYGHRNTDRSEISSRKTLEFGRTYRVTYRFMIEPGPRNTAEWLVIGQFHQTEDPGERGGSPPFTVEMTGERMRIVGRYSQQEFTSRSTYMSLYTDSTDLARGRWYEMKIRVRFDPYGDGLLAVWRDGAQLVDYYGPLGYADQVGPYWKHGVYRKTAPENFAVRFSDFNIVRVR